MKIFKKILLRTTTMLVLVLLSHSLILAQANFVSCLIVNNDGDTLKGSVDYRNWEKNPKSITFIKNGEQIATDLGPLSIKSFKVKNELYVSATVLTELSSTATNDLDYDPQLKTKIDTVFLLTLVEGPKSLYYLKNTQSIENYYIKTGDGFELLIYKAYFKDIDFNTVKVENKKFTGQLLLYFNDRPDANELVKNVAYKSKSLLAVFKKYYAAKKDVQPYFYIAEKSATYFGLVAGSTLTQIEFSSVDFPSLEKMDFPTNTNFTFGAYIDLALPRNLARWSIKTDLLFTSYSYKGEYLVKVNDDSYTKTSAYFNFSYMKISPMLRYKHKLNNIYLFANVGLSAGLAQTASAYRTIETKFYDYHDVKTSNYFDPPRKFEQGALMGAGVVYNNLSIETRFELGNGFSNQMGTSSNTTTFFFFLGYQFKKY